MLKKFKGDRDCYCLKIKLSRCTRKPTNRKCEDAQRLYSRYTMMDTCNTILLLLRSEASSCKHATVTVEGWFASDLVENQSFWFSRREVIE